MMTSMEPWEDIEHEQREKAYRRTLSDPSYLLSHDSALGIDAEMYHARLLGMDDEHVSDMWITSPLPIILVPLVRRRPLFAAEDDGPPQVEASRTATYVCQNAVTVVTFAEQYAPEGITLRPDFTFRVAYLLYKRRLS